MLDCPSPTPEPSWGEPPRHHSDYHKGRVIARAARLAVPVVPSPCDQDATVLCDACLNTAAYETRYGEGRRRGPRFLDSQRRPV